MSDTVRILIATLGFALLAFTYFAWFIYKNKNDDDTVELLGFFSLICGFLSIVACISGP